LLLPDPVKNVDSHEGQEMHALPQKEMLTLDSLMVEPHIRRASNSEHNAGIGKVIMLSEEWEPSPYKAVGDRMATFVPHVVASTTCWHVSGNGSGHLHRGAVSPRSIDFCILTGMFAETVVVVCVMEPH